MTDTTVQEKKDGESNTNVKKDGVTFKGESLFLTTEKDCDKVVAAIGTCKDLQYLNLEGNTLGVEGSKAISKALETKSELKRALWMDMFTGRMKEEIPKALEILGNGLTLAGAQLTELDLSDNAFGPIGVKGLAGLLSSRACYQLTVLKLNNNGLGSSGAEIVADALLECYKRSKNEGKLLQLKMFVAGRNRLENKGVTKLARVFQTLGTLEGIIIPQNSIYHKGIKALSDSLKNNPNLKVLDLNDNIITKKGAQHIAEALPHLQQLTVLNLGDCLLKNNGATVLANALTEKHEHLEELQLSFNEIKLDGGLALVEALRNKNKLKSFNVNGNMFGTAGRKLLKEGLESNKKIETLSNLSDDESKHDSDEESDVENEEVNSEENEESNEENEEVNSEENEEVNNEENKEPKSEDENEIEEKERNGFFPHKENPKSETDSSKVLTQIFSSLTIKQNFCGPIKTFLENPIVESFLSVKEEEINEFLKNNQDSSVEFYIDTFIPMLVKISSLSCCRNEDVEKLTLKISSNMYRDLFTWASDKNQLPTVNNALFVYLGLIKSEDKDLKINWNVKGSLSALKAVATQGSVPVETQEILKCLLEKEEKMQHPEEVTHG